MRPGRPMHINGSIAAASIEPIKVSIPLKNFPHIRTKPSYRVGAVDLDESVGGVTRTFAIRNTTVIGGAALDVSFNSGKDYFTLNPQESLDLEIAIKYFVIRCPTVGHAGVSYQAIAVLA